MIRRAILLLLSSSLAACGGSSAQKATRVILIDATEAPLQRSALAAPLLRSATAEGLISLDSDGRIVPALAERWIITDDGQSYIFRLRDSAWPDGTRLTAETAANALRQALAAQRGKPLGLDLDVIDEVRAMAARVVEIRLARPMPDFLQLLAQPELGLTHHGAGAGPMLAKFEEGGASLTAIPPEKRGLPQAEDWVQTVRPVLLTRRSAAGAVADMAAGRAEIVLGGTFADAPLAKALARFRLDPVFGLFGLMIEREDGLLSTALNREAIAMAIDRATMAARLGLPGWNATTRFVAPGLDGDPGLVGERWTDYDMAGRRTLAQNRIANWAHARHIAPHLSVALPDGPGGDLLAASLTADLGAIGITLERVDQTAPADLRLIDQVASYPAPTWFFNQFACAVRHPCADAADALLAKALASTPGEAPAFYAQAENALGRANWYIPLGQPVRWSLGAANAPGFSINRWGFHPLLPLANRAH